MSGQPRPSDVSTRKGDLVPSGKPSAGWKDDSALERVTVDD